MKKSDQDNSRRKFLSKSATTTGIAALASLFAGSARAQTMEINAMGPTPEQALAFSQLPDQPVVMVNLLKFAEGTGEDSYNQYSIDVSRILEQIGAEVIFTGECQTTFIGGAEWDRIAMVRYPNSRALLQMAQSSEYQAISGNRSSGLEGQMNIAVFES